MKLIRPYNSGNQKYINIYTEYINWTGLNGINIWFIWINLLLY